VNVEQLVESGLEREKKILEEIPPRFTSGRCPENSTWLDLGSTPDCRYFYLFLATLSFRKELLAVFCNLKISQNITLLPQTNKLHAL
jgi:hypothetical protein